ncbi:hypothetical protein [Mesoplasma lactucae]|uniref:Uncharacterized protein n=1 Tax=Mesoplasma lactucae ATCC 49193 TaxID=81460 RepID=A0A291IRQ4_9MOLU|nr:hypothetical protein [Mesoplasma lactucae]ATG97463.1 hypothetical protein CP520_01670 [Mesoplasma lactucae ATCC 49193]ATZ20082.1 hypothetical protein MLACT_v1c02610 [Mesoplasma lactucae ATCC 49193]MCL8216830.1 hypothetical protein [Mesoplasma lactucae ATCC 49193]
MKKMLGILASFSLVATGASSTMAMAPTQQSAFKNIPVSEITQKQFSINGDWQNTNDENAPSWSLSSQDSNYVHTFGKTVKKSSWTQQSKVSASFTIDFSRLGSNYESAKKNYYLNDFKDMSLKITTQAGQPAHHQTSGWGPESMQYSMFDILNEGNNYYRNGFNKNWDSKWARFSDHVETQWSKDNSLVKISWVADDLFVKAKSWTDGLFIRIELDGMDTIINAR